MADPLSIAASITAVLQMTVSVTKYLRTVKDASKEGAKLREELTNVTGILYLLKNHVEEAKQDDMWFATRRALNVPKGPLEQFKEALEHLESKLSTTHGAKKAARAITWPFRKEEVKDILATVERQKSLFSIALQNDHIRLSRAIQDGVSDINESLEKMRIDQKSQFQDQQLRDVLSWLSPLNFPSQHNDILANRQEGTGLWLLESNKFKNWMVNPGGLLFCTGIPGAGKTILASVVIDHLQETLSNRNSVVTYIYCRYQDRMKQSPKNLLASILKELLQDKRVIPIGLKSLYDSDTPPTSEKVLELLQVEMSEYTHKFLVIDALDELQDVDSSLRSFLSQLHVLQASLYLNIIMTSRPNPHIEREVREVIQVGDIHSNKLEVRASEQDVRAYVGGQMYRLRCIKSNLDLQENVKTEITTAADGMFLLARLQFDSLATKTSAKAIRKALREMPRGSEALYTVYDEVVARINNQPEDFRLTAQAVLSWIVSATRALTVNELQHALAIEPNETELDEENIPDIEESVSFCCGLVIIDQESYVIRAVHHTVEEYFARRCPEIVQDAQRDVAGSCLTYLSYQNFEIDCLDDEELDTRLDENPLLEYAANNWGIHAREVQDDVMGVALRFFRKNLNVLSSIQAIVNGIDFRAYERSKAVRRVHLCAYFGLEKILANLLNEIPMEADLLDTNGRTPLSLAARYGRDAAAKLLLDRGNVKINLEDIDGQTPLHHAVAHGHLKTVELLLEQPSIDVNSKGNQVFVPLSFAAYYGDKEIVQLFLKRDDVDLNSKDVSGRTALSYAARCANKDIVQLFLERDDIDTNSKENFGQTPLFYAAESGHEDVVQLFLERGDVDINFRDDSGQTPLSYAARYGHKEMMQLFLERGDIDINSKDKSGQTPLFYAAESGHEDIVQLFLERGDVDINSKDDSGQTPLFYAVNYGRKEVVQLLLKQDDVEINSQNDYGRTPLSIAVLCLIEIVELLLKRDDIEPDIQDNNGITPLSWAAQRGHVAITQLLLAHLKVKATLKDNYGRTPLTRAKEYQHESVVRLLLERDDVLADEMLRHYGLQAEYRERYGEDAATLDNVKRVLLEWRDNNPEDSKTKLEKMKAELESWEIDLRCLDFLL